MTFSRKDRVAELIQSEIAALLVHGAKDPRVGGVVITRVDLSPDLRQAKVFFSRYAEGVDEEAYLEEGLLGLERARGFLQGKLAERLELRKTPKLRFIPDRGLAYSDEIERLLAKVRRDEENGEKR